MKTKLILFCALLSLLAYAQVPQLLNYQGRVAVGAVNFGGTGQFRFALVSADGSSSYWSNDGTSTAGSQPSAAVSLAVTKGLYSVLLGDTSIPNMAAIPASVWANTDVRLRVWFDDGVNGSQLLTPDQRLAPNGYLPDGSVSSATISDGAVTSAKMADNAITAAKLNDGAVTSAKLATDAVQEGNIAAAAVTAAKLGADVGLWSVSGSNVFRSAGNVGIGTANPFRKLQIDGDFPAILIGDEYTPGRTSLLLGVTANSGGMSIIQSISSAGGAYGPLSLQKYGGNVGIGTDTPTAKLHVNGDIQADTITATAFSGSGTTLTNLSASNISSGTLADARLSPNVPLLDAGNTFTSTQTLAVGTTTLAPLKLQTGVNLTTPQFGAVEFDGSNLFLTTDSGSPTRKTLAFTDSVISPSQIAAGSITSTMLADGSVGSAKLAAGAMASSVNVSGSTQAALANTSYVATGASQTTFTLPTTANVGDTIQLSATGAGGWSTIGWTARESDRYWLPVASSADGNKLVAVENGGQIYTSTDSGVSWTARESNRDWLSVASSADGSKLVAVEVGGQIYTSADSGVSWTARESNRGWHSVASSADGSKLVAVEAGGKIYTSTDSGVSWTARESDRNWSSVASSADGNKLVAVEIGGKIYTSADSGVSWTVRENNRSWTSVTSSADGSKLVAVVGGGQIYISADSGLSWTARESNRDWQSVASSADGSKLVAVVFGGKIYTSADSGLGWTAQESTRDWASVASSADGSKLVAVVLQGQIYTSSTAGLGLDLVGAQGTTATLTYTNTGWVPVAESQIATGAVRSAQLADSSVTGDKVADGTITDVDIADAAAISDSKLATLTSAGKVANSATTATTANTGNSIVLRDATGDFSANTITAALNGNAATATTAGSATNFTGSLTGDVTGTQSATSISATTVTGKALSGFSSTTGTLSATDTILSAFNKLDGNIALKAPLASPTFTGTVSGTFSGDGSALTSLNASNLSSGSLADARLSGNVPLLDISNTFSSTQTFAAGTTTLAPIKLQTGVNLTSPQFGAVEFDGTNLYLTNNSGTPTRKTLAFTDSAVSSSQIDDGSIVNADISASAAIADTKLATLSSEGKVANSATTATTANTGSSIVLRDATGNFSANIITAALNGNAATATTAGSATIATSATDFTGALAGDVTGTQAATTIAAATVTGKALTGFSSTTGTLTASDTLLSALGKLDGNQALKAPIASPTFTGTVSGTFSGDGSALTSLSASNLSSGTLADARLSSNVPLLDISNTFTSTQTFASGTTTLAPLKLQTGVNLSSPQFGAVEFDGTNLYLTNNSGTPTRKTLAFTDSAISSSQIADGSIVNADISASAAIADTKLATLSTAGKVANSATTGTSSNTSNTLILRNASGNFSAGTITAALNGNAATATTAGSATNFTGSLTGDVTGTQSATSISAATVTGKAITGFSSTIGTITASDTVLSAINKLNGNDALKAPLASPTFTGTVSGTFSGNGSALTSLNASNLSSGTLADARLSSNVPLLDISNTFSSTQTFAVGTTTLAPIKLQTGVNLTTPQFGAVEFNGTNLFLTTNSGSPTRKTLAFTDSVISPSQIAAGSITSTMLADGSVGSAKLAAGAVAPSVNVSGATQTALANTSYLATGASQTSFTLPTTATVGDTIQLNATGTGGWSIGWTARASNRNWSSVASSADGSKLVAVVNGGQIYTSTDFGVSWTARESNRSWRSVASSADGSKLVAVVQGGQIYTSSNSGVNWTVRESNRFWRSVALSADGSKLVAVEDGGQIYTSADSGVSWTAWEIERRWASVASSADGSKLVAVVQGGQIYTSTFFGTSWTASESNREWSSVASSADGSKLVAVVNGGQIYTSTDFGVSWTARESDRSWYSVASSADGSRLVALVFGGQIYTSSKAGLELPGAEGTTTTLTYSGAEWIPVTQTQIADGAVGSAQLADGSIMNADIAATAAISDSKLATLTSAGKVANSATTATTANTGSSIVLRDATGNFSANTITAALNGSATTFTGSLTGDVTGTQSATSISAATVTGKAITGFSSTTGTITASDTVLSAINKLNGNVALKAPLASPTFTGTVTVPANGLIVGTNQLVAAGNKIGIGVSVPDAALHVVTTTAGSGNNTAAFSAPNIGSNQSHIHYGTTGDWIIRSASSSGTVIMQDSGGGVGIGRTPLTNKLEVEGNASKTTATAWLANSDRRIKQDIQPIGNALDTLNRVRLVDFRYTDGYRAQHPSIEDRRYLNVIAQEFAGVFPDYVKPSGEKLEDGSAILQVDTYPLTIYAAAAVQELSQKLKAKDAEIADLKRQLEASEAKDKAIEARLTALEQGTPAGAPKTVKVALRK